MFCLPKTAWPPTYSSERPVGGRSKLWGAGARRAIVRPVKRVRGVRAKARARFPMTSPGRQKPKGVSSGWWTNTPSDARDSRKDGIPGTAAYWAGPALRRWEHR